MEVKYIIEMDVQDSVLENLRFAKAKIDTDEMGRDIFTVRNSAGLTLDDIVELRIKPAMRPLCGDVILVYRAEEGKDPIDLFKICSACNHPWGAHFITLGPDNKILHPAMPVACAVCKPEKPCNESEKYKK